MLASLKHSLRNQGACKGETVWAMSRKQIPKPISVLGVKFINLDSVVVAGCGVRWFVMDEANTFSITVNGLMARDVNITYSESVHTVHVYQRDVGTVEVAYRVLAEELNSFAITVRLAGSIHSVHNAFGSLSSKAACRYIFSMPPITDLWFRVLEHHCLDWDVFYTFCVYTFRNCYKQSWKSLRLAFLSVMGLAAKHHILKESAHVLCAEFLNGILSHQWLFELIADHDVPKIVDYIFAVMHAHPGSILFTQHALHIVKALTRMKPSYKRLLLDKRLMLERLVITSSLVHEVLDLLR